MRAYEFFMCYLIVYLVVMMEPAPFTKILVMGCIAGVLTIGVALIANREKDNKEEKNNKEKENV